MTASMTGRIAIITGGARGMGAATVRAFAGAGATVIIADVLDAEGAALAADRTLGGLCDWAEADAPRPIDLPVEGAASLKAAVIPVVLHYSTADPLG